MEFVQQLDSRYLLAFGLAGVILLWLVWSVAKKIVRIGYFLIAFALGCAISIGVSAVMGNPPNMAFVAAQGMGFAFMWTAIRAKVARVITAIAVLLALKLGFGLLSDDENASPEPVEPAKASSKIV